MSREQHHSCLCFHACACCTKWEGRRLPWSNHSDFWPANAVHPLLPSHPHSLLSFSQVASPHSFSPSLHTPICYCKPPPFLPFSQTCAAAPHSPAHLLFAKSSSSCGVLPLFARLTPVPQAQIPWESSVFVTSAWSPPAAVLTCCPYSTTHRAPAWFQCLTNKIFLVANRKKSRYRLHLPKNPLGCDT